LFSAATLPPITGLIFGYRYSRNLHFISQMKFPTDARQVHKGI
jgi:hypothetical protein